MVTIASSVFAGAPPRPGKCLAVAATPPARQPLTASRTASLATAGSRENDLPASAASRTLGTSATGANVTVTPAARNARAEVSAAVRTVPFAS